MVAQPIISALESSKQEDCHEFGASLDYKAVQAFSKEQSKTKTNKPVLGIAGGLWGPF